MYDDIIGWVILLGLIGIAFLFMYLAMNSVKEIKTIFREYRTFETYRIQKLYWSENQ